MLFVAFIVHTMITRAETLQSSFVRTICSLQDEAALVNHRYEKYRALGTYSLLTNENERLAVIEVRF